MRSAVQRYNSGDKQARRHKELNSD